MKNKNQILDSIQDAQKTLILKVNSIANNEEVKKTVRIAQDYGQKIAHNLAKELEKRGKITAQEAKKLMKEVNKRSGHDKAKLYKSIKHDSNELLLSMKNVVINSLALARKFAHTNKPTRAKNRRKTH